MSAELIDIAHSDVDLWLTFYEDIADPELLSAYRTLLNPAEKAQEPRFYFENDRRRYLVTRALVRTVLSRYASVEPSDWTFSNNAYGRPAIANQAVANTGLSFNISHTRSLIVLGVTRSRELGVDVENFMTRQVGVDLAERFFAPEEVAELATVPTGQQQYRFFEYWTFKEAYIKARGMGLSLPLDKFSFSYPSEDTVALSIRPELNDEARRWRLWQFQPRTGYLVAICAERLVDPASRIRVRQVVPLLRERALAPKFLRTSG